jgi:hypothetical protein
MKATQYSNYWQWIQFQRLGKSNQRTVMMIKAEGTLGLFAEDLLEGMAVAMKLSQAATVEVGKRYVDCVVPEP